MYPEGQVLEAFGKLWKVLEVLFKKVSEFFVKCFKQQACQNCVDSFLNVFDIFCYIQEVSHRLASQFPYQTKLETKNAAKRNMSSAVCALFMNSRLCMKMSSFLFVIFIMWNSISGLDACYHLRLNISCGVAVTVRSHQKKYQVTF